MAFLKQSYKGYIRLVNYTKVGPKQVTHTLLAKKFMRHDECRAIKALRTLSSRGVLGFGLGSCPGNGSPWGRIGISEWSTKWQPWPEKLPPIEKRKTWPAKQ